MLKRNDVVINLNNRGWNFYGRVWKRLDSERVVVIDCGKNVLIYKDSDLELTDYNGNYKWNHEPGNTWGNPVRFLFMPNLRKLKKAAKIYNPDLMPDEYSDE